MKRYLYASLLLLSLSTYVNGQQASFVETFDNNNQAWPFIEENSIKSNTMSIANGHLVINGDLNSIQTYKDVGLAEETDFAIYTRMIFLDGIHSEFMGLRFMMSADGEKYCSFVYNNDRAFLIATNNGKKREILRQSTSSVIKGTDYNTLTVIKIGTTFKFLINDKQVHEAKIKSYFGPLVALMTNSRMKIQVDEIQVYDPKKGKTKTIPSMLAVAAPVELDKVLQNTEAQMPPAYKQFYDSFEKFAFPYDYSTVIDRAKDISQLPFVQNKYFAYERREVTNHTVSAVAHLAICKTGSAFLLAHQYVVNNQEVTRFSVEAFDLSGNSIGQKDLGSFIKEPKGYYQTLDFKITRDGNAIFLDGTERLYNGNRTKKAVSFNAELCNL